MSADLGSPSPFAGVAWEPGVAKPDPILVADGVRGVVFDAVGGHPVLSWSRLAVRRISAS